MAHKLEVHHTPVHGAGLTMAERELSVLAKQCLKEPIASFDFLQQEVQAWTKQRNEANMSVDWRFTTDDARSNLKKLYPSMLPG